MYEKMKDNYKITFIRGATTASGNSVKEIEDAVFELIDELITRNNILSKNILSIIFTSYNCVLCFYVYFFLIYVFIIGLIFIDYN